MVLCGPPQFGDGIRRASQPERLSGVLGEFSNAIESFTAKDGLTDDVAVPILQDREGNIWVGTQNGLQTTDGKYPVSYQTL
jgi:hypothetical protein